MEVKRNQTQSPLHSMILPCYHKGTLFVLIPSVISGLRPIPRKEQMEEFF